MVSRAAVGIGAVAVVVAAVGAGAFVAGLGPFDDDTAGNGSRITDFPTATGTPYGNAGGSGGGSGSGSDGGSTTATATSGGSSLPPYAFEVTNVEECGQTCRDVTVTLTNNRNETAENVTVFTRIFAGNSTDEGDLVWEDREDIGRLGAGESTTSTKRVELSYSEGYTVQQRDGWITILTTVESDEVTVTFKERRDVI